MITSPLIKEVNSSTNEIDHVTTKEEIRCGIQRITSVDSSREPNIALGHGEYEHIQSEYSNTGAYEDNGHHRIAFYIKYSDKGEK